MKYKIIFFLIIIVIIISLPENTRAKTSGVPGSTFYNTCATQMADVPLNDAYADKSEAGNKSYALSSWYEDAVRDWRTTHLQKITFANQNKDVINKDIYVHKNAATYFKEFGEAVADCSEVKEGTYKIKIYDHFTCRLITPSTGLGTTLSTHAFGFSIDINVKENKYTTKPCESSGCNYSPCFLKAAKDNNISWGGGINSNPVLYTGICDGHHFEWRNGQSSNISDSDLNFCGLSPAVTAIQSITGPSSKIGLISEVELILQKPRIQIKIPGLSFTENIKEEDSSGTYIVIPFLGEYLASLYRYGVVVASIFSIIMIIISGFKWSTSGGTPEKINEAKKRITQSIVGLLLAVGSFALLYNINPELVKFRNLRVQTIEGQLIENLEVGYYEEGSIEGIANYNLINGGYVKNALSPSACVDYQGFSLDTREKRAARLKQILKTWKNIAVDQGGAIYSIGGRIESRGTCKNGGGAPYLGAVISQAILMQNIKLNKEAKIETGPIRISDLPFLEQNITTAKSLFVGATNCWDLLTTSAFLSLQDKDVQKDNTISRRKVIDKGLKKFNLAGPEAIDSCNPIYKKLYSNLYSDVATASGRLCGDCGTFQESLLYNCFDTRIVGKEIEKKYNFKKTPTSKTYQLNESNIADIEKSINFGSIIKLPDPRHWIMYTGKANDSAINYVIFEMGGGYSGKTANSTAGKKIRESFNPSYFFSTVKTNTDFKAYMRSAKFPKITVIDILNPSDFPAF